MFFIIFLLIFVECYENVVFGYLPEWRYEGADFNGIFQTVSHLMLFSLEMSPKTGEITALDRIPRNEIMKQIQSSAKKYNSKVMICFGGNGRSSGFSNMSRNKKLRRRFLKDLVNLVRKYDFDGVDYNWEYPGYSFRSGYQSENVVVDDYEGLKKLIIETKAVFKKVFKRKKLITMAYYPDGKQEKYIKEFGISNEVDFLHIMSYDQHGGSHSTIDFAKQVSVQAKKYSLPLKKVTLGLPFYGRNSLSGEWISYEDIVRNYYQKNKKEIPKDLDKVGSVHFNGWQTIKTKSEIAKEMGLGGVMIWEIGQDCRQTKVVHGKDVHIKTCTGSKTSLLSAISEAFGIDKLSPFEENEL